MRHCLFKAIAFVYIIIHFIQILWLLQRTPGGRIQCAWQAKGNKLEPTALCVKWNGSLSQGHPGARLPPGRNALVVRATAVSRVSASLTHLSGSLNATCSLPPTSPPNPHIGTCELTVHSLWSKTACTRHWNEVQGLQVDSLAFFLFIIQTGMQSWGQHVFKLTAFRSVFSGFCEPFLQPKRPDCVETIPKKKSNTSCSYKGLGDIFVITLWDKLKFSLL